MRLHQIEQLLTIALAWEGTPYHAHGRLKGVGVDCAMFLAEVYHAAGLVPYIDPGHYPIDWHLHRDEEKFMTWVKKFATEVFDPRPGDVVLFRTGRAQGHGGIVIDWPLIIHAKSDFGVCREDITGTRLGRLRVRFWRMEA